MRVIAGEFRSRRLKSLPGTDLRPTPDRVREALFNVLAPELEGCLFVDAYAGTGAVGIEALSRGASRAIFLEKHRAAAALIRENLEALGLLSRATIAPGPAGLTVGQYAHADMVFLDPPYPLENEYALVLNVLGRSATPLVIAQHSVRFELGDDYGSLARVRKLRNGENVLSFFRHRETI